MSKIGPFKLAIKSVTKSGIEGIEELDFNIVEGCRVNRKLKIEHYGIERSEWLQFIKDNNFVLLMKKGRGEIWGDEDDSFRRELCPDGLTPLERDKIGTW